MTQEIYENQVITQTLVTQENLLTGVAIGTFQEDFQLCEADFLRLKSEGSAMATWSLNILFASIGYGMSILPKWISEISGKPEKVTQSEWAVLALGIAVSAVLFVINKLIPNEKKHYSAEWISTSNQHQRVANSLGGKNDYYGKTPSPIQAIQKH